MKIKGISLGCKVNTYEMEYVLSSFKDHGYEITDEFADIYVIVVLLTCLMQNQEKLLIE